MRILITGGAGFIGSNLVRKLHASNHEIIVYDNLSRGKRDHLPPEIELIEGDIRNRESMSAVLCNIDAVIHLAAYGSVVESVNDPWTNFDINALGTLSVLDGAKKAGVKRLIFASTGGALIGEATPPVDESSLPKPISPYGASKLCGEAYCHSFSKSYGLPVVSLRFANVYGPYSAHKKGAVTKFIKCLMRDEVIPIFGDGSASRDYLHVEDLCKGIELALGADISPGEVFHLSSGIETEVLVLAKTIAQLFDQPDHPLSNLPNRPGEVSRNFARYDKAASVLGFKPAYTLNEGLRETIEWYQQNKAIVLNSDESDS